MTPNAKPAADPQVTPIVTRCRAVLERHYGPRFAGLVLYGSTARGTAGRESDLDLLVLLRGEFDYFAELRIVIALLYPAQLDSGRWISARPASVADFEAGALQLYRNAAREGRRLAHALGEAGDRHLGRAPRRAESES